MRNLIRANESIANTCYAGNKPLEAILEETEKSIFDLIQTGNTGDYVPVRQIVLNVFDKKGELIKEISLPFSRVSFSYVIV